MNHRTIVLLSLALLLACTDDTSVEWQAAYDLNHELFVFDAHCDSALNIVDHGADLGQLLEMGHVDLPRMISGGLNAQVFAAWTAPDYWPDHATERARELLTGVRRFVDSYPQQIGIALSGTEAEQLFGAGKIAVFLGIEGGHAIEDSLETLRQFHGEGVRIMTLTWMTNTNWADASGDTPVHGGLTEFGVQVVREMNRLGMVVDISHVSDDTFYDTLKVSSKPVVASHSCVRSLHDHHRNMTDEMLRALAQNGGVIGLNFFPDYLAPRGAPVTVETLVDHIDHAVRVAGIDHVGLGSDFDGVPALPLGIEDVSDLPAITEVLMARSYTRDDIEKILGGNLLRVFKAALDN